MLTLVVGGAASGKSEYAEGLAERSYESACRQAENKLPVHLYYLATMEGSDRETKERIQTHVDRRAGKAYETVETPRASLVSAFSAELPMEQGQTIVLLDCLGTLTANELFAGGTLAEDPKAVRDCLLRTLLELERNSDDLIVVSNDVFSGGNAYEGDTDTYLQVLAALQNALAAEADHVVEVVSGIPAFHKGGRT